MDRLSDDMLLMYIEGELDAQQALKVEQTLAHDEQTRRQVALMITDRERLRAMPRQPAPPEILARVMRSRMPDLVGDGKSTNKPAAKLSVAPPTTRPVPARPAFRWNIALAYGSLAAMLILGTGVVLETLSNRKIIDLAQNRGSAEDANSVAPPIAVPQEPMVATPAIPAPLEQADASKTSTDPMLGAGNRVTRNFLNSGADQRSAPLAMTTNAGDPEQPMIFLAPPIALPRHHVLMVPEGVASSGGMDGSRPSGSAAGVSETGGSATPTLDAMEANQAADWLEADVYRDGSLAAGGAPILVVTPSAQKCEEQINAWARKAHAQIVSVATTTVLPGPTKKTAAGASTRRRLMVVQLMPQQVNPLLTFLNSQNTQFARLGPANSPAPFSLAAPAVSSTTEVTVAHPRMTGTATTQPTTNPVAFEPGKPSPVRPISLSIIISE